MIIAGAKGFAKEIIEVFWQLKMVDNLCLFDDVNTDLPEKVFDQFVIITEISKAAEYLETIDNRFVLGVGTPYSRRKLAEKLKKIGGSLQKLISPLSHIGHFDIEIGAGVTVMTSSVITSSVAIGIGTLINKCCIISHDVQIGEYCDIAPNVKVLGGVCIGNNSFVGAGSVILPNVSIGDFVTIGAGSVVTEDVPDCATVVGVPAKALEK